jgi:hypothetical protein
MRKSEIKLESFLNRCAAIRSREEGIEDGSIITVVLGGREMAFSMIWRAALWIRWREMEERTVEERREV